MPRRSIAAAIAGLSAAGLVAAMSSSAATGAGAPGTLDPTFGKGGEVISNVGGFPVATVQQPNGDILVALDQGTTGAVARFLSNGTLDTSFGSGGVAKAATSGEIALESSGKILVAGGANGESGFTVERLNSNGQPDTTFGTAGVATATSPEEGSVAPNCLLVEPSGKVLLGGYRLVSGRPESLFGFVVRFNANGTLDTAFGKNGQVNLTAAGEGPVDALGLDAHGDIFALDAAAQTELSPTGSIDASVTPATITSSSKGGFATFGGIREFLPNGKSLEGHAVTTSKRGYEAQIQRFSPAGALDSSFASPLFRYNGETSTLGKDSIDEVVVGANGKIVVVGQHHAENTPAGVGEIGVERIDANGELDTTFGKGGGVTANIAEVNTGYTAVVEPSGDVVVAGLASKGETSHVVLLRYQG